jgi:CheY-like chemotaxis protein
MKGNGLKKIMVVDDNEDMIFMLRIILEKDGYKVIGANSGEECLKKVNIDRPDLILMDIMMPGMDGWEVCREIKSSGHYPSVPVSMLSVRKDIEDITRSITYAMADAHVAKPINFDELKKTVATLLG